MNKTWSFIIVLVIAVACIWSLDRVMKSYNDKYWIDVCHGSIQLGPAINRNYLRLDASQSSALQGSARRLKINCDPIERERDSSDPEDREYYMIFKCLKKTAEWTKYDAQIGDVLLGQFDSALRKGGRINDHLDHDVAWLIQASHIDRPDLQGNARISQEDQLCIARIRSRYIDE